MGKQVNLGGDRLGSGAKMNVELHNYERSTHDLGYIWRSTMAPGTLVPFMTLLALPGDTFDIDLESDVKTHPTVGPLFGSFKLQKDIFLCPIRLYNALLHNNKLGIGLDMSRVKLPQLDIYAPKLNYDLAVNEGVNIPLEFQQVNQSCILAYLGIRGISGKTNPLMQQAKAENENMAYEQKNAVPYLAYWDIYKNYYANKQEEIGAVVTSGETVATADNFRYKLKNGVFIDVDENPFAFTWPIFPELLERLDFNNINIPDFENLYITWNNAVTGNHTDKVTAYFKEVYLTRELDGKKRLTMIYDTVIGEPNRIIGFFYESQYTGLKIKTFPLSNLDDMREDILSKIKETAPFTIGEESIEPYCIPFKPTTLPPVSEEFPNERDAYNMIYPLEGLGLKTYQSDIFNNWLNSEFIDGTNGISAITAISTESGSFTIDTLNLSQKVYELLNRVAVSGGSYEDWLEAVYTHEAYRRAETPMYMGGMSREVIFQEVVSTAVSESEAQGLDPLGTLAGKGRQSERYKGGKVVIKVDEPSYVIGIVSLTPRIDYSQGNNWDMNLKTLDDLHKPALDQIGFQDLITEQMAFWDTDFDNEGNKLFYAAGKQPAWINYMTNHNKTYGNFADPRNEMFMTLNRRYEANELIRIKDLTTYIDPAKYNYMFAQTDITAQNFWVQIACDITARRKMSAKIMPNL